MSESGLPLDSETDGQAQNAADMVVRPRVPLSARVSAPVMDHGAGPLNATYVQQLSLFLMLLSFFLALTINSEFELARVAPVLGGVQQAFGYAGTAASGPASDEQPHMLPIPHGGLQPLGDGLTAELAGLTANGARSSVGEPGSLSRTLTLSPGALFVEGSAAARAQSRQLVEQVGQILSRYPAARVVVLVPDVASQRLGGRRAASLTRLLIGGGARQEQLIVGLADDDAGDVSLRFFSVVGV